MMTLPVKSKDTSCLRGLTSDGAADAVQVRYVRVGGVDLPQVLLHLRVAVVTELQRGGGPQEEEQEEVGAWR